MSETTVTIDLGAPTLAALDRYIREREPTLTREQALSKVVAAWLAAQPGPPHRAVDEGMRPEQLNASNDE